ncbi:MAG: hypothetical protein GX986_02780 [Firmicutes bacterium]|nr:hypothetical protein [Bacillota bacterium]
MLDFSTVQVNSSPKLREADAVVAVAGGEHKLAPILATLYGHWIDILVTDAMTGQRLLQLARQS